MKTKIGIQFFLLFWVLTTCLAPKANTDPSVGAERGIYTDPRDWKVYHWVKIGNLIWMADNMRFATAPSGSFLTWVADKQNYTDKYEAKYGYLYSWEAAPSACPPGWRLPTREDWDNLGRAAGGTRATKIDSSGGEVISWAGVAPALKATTGWRTRGVGTDAYGFSAFPGSYYDNDFSRVTLDDLGASWWTADKFNGTGPYRSGWVYSRHIGDFSVDLYEGITPISRYKRSVRAVRDDVPPATPGAPPPKDRSSFVLAAFSSDRKSTVPDSRSFYVNYRIRNTGSFQSFDARVVLVLIDDNGKVLIVNDRNVNSIPAGSEFELKELLCYVPDSAYPVGKYQLMLRMDYYPGWDKEEKLITQSSPGVPAAIDFTIMPYVPSNDNPGH